MSRGLQSVLLVLMFGLGVLVGASALNTGTAQPPPAPNPPSPHAAWRYQLYLDSPHSYVYLLDTATGRAWGRFRSEDWFDLKTPPGLEKK